MFKAPWEAQAFAMTLSLYARGVFTWREWADALAAETRRSGRDAGEPDDGSHYYEHWLAALEKLVAGRRPGDDAESSRAGRMGSRRRARRRTASRSSCRPAEVGPAAGRTATSRRGISGDALVAFVGRWRPDRWGLSWGRTSGIWRRSLRLVLAGCVSWQASPQAAFRRQERSFFSYRFRRAWWFAAVGHLRKLRALP